MLVERSEHAALSTSNAVEPCDANAESQAADR